VSRAERDFGKAWNLKEFRHVDAVVEEYRTGHFVIIVDDEDRENEGDLAFAGQTCTPDKINFMTKYGRGLICVALESKRLDELKIPPMVQENSSRFETAFSVSVEAREGTTTGISSADRATTILRLVDPKSSSKDFVMPGHTFPLRAREGGVLARGGQTEASVDLAKMAGMFPAGVICEIMNDDGTMARLPQLLEFSKRHGIQIISVADLIRYRQATG
jgi:3,4-dihydroxy 2-butanone 4-phosphate synthase / GTP cyclohydrolase II